MREVIFNFLDERDNCEKCYLINSISSTFNLNYKSSMKLYEEWKNEYNKCSFLIDLNKKTERNKTYLKPKNIKPRNDIINIFNENIETIQIKSESFEEFMCEGNKIKGIYSTYEVIDNSIKVNGRYFNNEYEVIRALMARKKSNIINRNLNNIDNILNETKKVFRYLKKKKYLINFKI